MATYPGSLAPFLDRQFHDDDGNPLAGGFLFFYIAGTDTPKDTYTDATIALANLNPVELDAAGRADIFFGPGGYKVVCTDSLAVELWSIDGCEDIGLTFLSELGLVLSEGPTAQTSGYVVLAADLTVLMDGTGGVNPCIVNLPAAADHPQPVLIKNTGTVPLAVTPNGAEVIDTLTGAFTVSEVSGTTFPSVWLWPVSGGWLVAGSHGLV